MKLLVDQNLSRHLVDHVRDVFPDSPPVALRGLAEATDEEVWEVAGANDDVVVSIRSFRIGGLVRTAPSDGVHLHLHGPVVRSMKPSRWK